MNKIILSETVLEDDLQGVVGVWHIDTEEEFDDLYTDLMNNSDFTYLGQFDMTQDIDDELEYQGLTGNEIAQISLNMYGVVLEVLDFEDSYHAFIGAN